MTHMIIAGEAPQRELVQGLGGDAELVQQLEADGYSGVRFELAREQLWTYAVRALTGMMRNGSIAASSRAGIWANELKMLERDRDLRDQLALETVIAVDAWWFGEEALGLNAWDPAKGASLRTYFMGACLSSGFPNVLRSWRRKRLKSEAASARHLERIHDSADQSGLEAVILRAVVREVLAEATLVQKSICGLIYTQDLTHKEIGKVLGNRSAAAVGAQLNRLRTKVTRLVRIGVLDVPTEYLASAGAGSAVRGVN
ncbi:RNA polymerase sigma factor [Kitasatospora sp. NBC_00315]|uniref:RNA polymerase sigma factor n=1 Tax=Kitasatospora sp. NBC_00315 TaxID=2975963 RepID=UPI00324D1832